MRLLDDLREAARSLRKQPRFLIIASLTLALGIGAVTSIFSVVNGVLFKPLPHPHAERLANIWSTAPAIGYDQFPLSPDLFLFYRKHNTVFEDMALFQGRRANLTESGLPEVVEARVTTHSYFATLGAGLSRGRAYTAEEDTLDAPRVVVLSHRLWTRRYGADPSLVGRTVRVDGQPTEVVGIAPQWLDERGSPELWLPARFNPADPPTGNFGWNAVGRLKRGVRPDQAEAHLEPLVRRAMTEHIQSQTYRAFLTDGRYRPVVHSMKEDVIGSVREPLWILLGTVAMVLLVACGNVANLCLIRAESRQREIAIRTALDRAPPRRRWALWGLVLRGQPSHAEIGVRIALGAPPSRVRREVMANAAIITAIGLVVGALGAAGLTRFLRGLLHETQPLDLATFAGMSALLFAVGLLASYLPARKAAAVSPMEAMRTD